MDRITRRIGRRIGLSILASVALFGAGLTTACSSSRSVLVGGDGSNDGLLKGNYTYSLGGEYSGASMGLCSYCTNGAYERSGTFVADGDGHITSGNDEFVQGAALVTNSLSGSYSIASDGTGIMLLTIGNEQMQLALVMVSNSSLSWIEFDSFGGGAGGAKLQDSGALTTAPAGTFIFHIHSSEPNSGSQNSVSSVGRINISGGTVSGREDEVRENVFGSPTLTGSASSPNPSGTGTLTLTDSNGVNSSFVYYIIDSNTLSLMETDFDQGTGKPRFGVGRAESQAGVSFDDTSVQGSFAFSSSGETLSTPFSVVTVGSTTYDGSGNITSGSYDSVASGIPVVNAPVAGGYAVSAEGRVSITLTTQAPGLPSIPEVAWMVNSSRAFFLVDLPGRAEDGAADLQQNAPYSQASLNGLFVFSTFGGDNKSPSQVSRVGLASFDGQSNLTLTNYFVNRGGSKNQTSAAPVSYSVTPNGRVSAQVPGMTSSLVMYLSSTSSTSLIFEDPQSAIGGSMTQQQISP